MIFIVLVQNNVTAVFAEPGTPERLEARSGIEPPMKVLQTFALPLGYRAPKFGRLRLSRGRCRRLCRRIADRRADEIAPFGPRPVVAAHVVEAQEVLQLEPGVRAALADAAIGDDLFAAVDPLASVKLLQLVVVLEGAVFPRGLDPGDVGRARNVACPL